ncbi:MAG: PLP-dependent aspartate aminotransferase family protein [Pirellulales bacterium]
MKFRTRAIHVGNPPDPQTGAVVTPIHPATTFVQPGPGDWGTFDYSRSGNPTRAAVEQTMASLEGGCGALAFASGMAATHCVTMLLSAGEKIVAGTDIYGGSYRLLHKITNRSGVEVKLVDLNDLHAFEKSLTPEVKLVWFECIGNPRLTVPDLDKIVEIAHRHNILVGVDNTFATPVLLRPLEHGVDIVMHSATKYFGGHSDCLSGVIAVRDPELHKKLYFIQNATGAVLSPFESFLLARGLKTLDLRVREQCRSALKIAEFLAGHPQVEEVLYPGLATHPDHARAAKLLGGLYGAMITFAVRGGDAPAKRVCKATKLFHLAVSLGAVESLIEHPATMSHASYDPAARAKAGIHDNLVRLSVGLEDVEDLIADLDTALNA